jgi:hypothetical protein
VGCESVAVYRELRGEGLCHVGSGESGGGGGENEEW